MKKILQNKKLVITLSVILAVVIAAGVGILVWQLTKDDAPDPDTYTITFVTNGGNEIEPMTVEKGAVLSHTDLPVPAKRGVMFLTWNTDEALTAPYWNTPIESDITLYASYLEPANDEQINELIEAIIPFADADFSVTVRSSIELTNDNIGNYVVLTVRYGKHESGEAIKLSVSSEGGDRYRISGNFATGGEYVISLVSDAVTFDPDDEMLLAHGLTEELRTLHFRIIGETYMNGELSDKVADIPDENIVVQDADSITVTGGDLVLIGATEEENGVIRVGEGDDISNYYKIVDIESSTADGITYTVRPAEVEEIYDRVEGYQWIDLDGDDLVINEEVKQQVMDNLANNEQLNNYVKYLTLAATHTPTYQTLSTQEFGEVVAMPLSTVVTPSGITMGLDFDVYNDQFSSVLKEEQYDQFVKLTLGISYEVKMSKLGSMGSVTASVDLLVDFWVFVGFGGHFEVGFFEYDIDYGVSVLTQTEITFKIGLQTSSGKKYPNIDQEIEAIFNSATNPTPENLLEQYNELMGGSSQAIELFNQEIFQGPNISLLAGAVKISIPVRFVVSIDIEASFTSYFTVLTGDAFGIRGDEDTGLDTFHLAEMTRYKYRLELKGRMELRSGVEVGVKISLGYGLGSVSINAQAGFYAEIHGYFFYEVDYMNPKLGRKTSMGGAYYFEFGTYIDIRLRAEVCLIKYSGSLWNIKFPLLSAGQKEVLYGFVNPTDDVILLENVGMTYIDDTGILDVYVYDITEERSDTNPRIIENYPFDLSKFELTFSDDDFRISGYYKDEIWLNTGSVVACESILTMRYTGAQMSFRDAITKYVSVRYVRGDADDVDWERVSIPCTITFTINGEAVFTRELPYGSWVSGYGTFYFRSHGDGTKTRVLRQSEMDAIYAAGYDRVEWRIDQYITDDMSVEAVHGIDYYTKKEAPVKRTVTYTVQTPAYTSKDVLTVDFGEIPDLSQYEDDKYSVDDRLTFDRWSVEPYPLTDDGVVFTAIYKPITVTVNVDVAGTTVGDTVYDAQNYSAKINKGDFANKVFNIVPNIGQKTLVFYTDAEYTKLADPYPTVWENEVTYYARYEDHAYVLFFNQYYQGVLTKKVNIGETVTLTDEELALFTYCDPADIERGIRFTYKGMTDYGVIGGEIYDLSVTPVDKYNMNVFPVFDKEYKVTFLNGDGSVLEERYYPAGTELAGIDLVPTKAPDTEFDYTFRGWVKENGSGIGNIDEPMTLKPNYEKDVAVYTVTFLNHDGMVFDERTFAYGEDVADAQGAPSYFDERYNYVFSHWENYDGAELGTIVKDHSIFKPVYTVESDVLYTVTFMGAGDAVTEDGKPLALSEQYKFDELESVISAYLDFGIITKKLNGSTYVLDSYTITPNMGGICIVDLEFAVANASVTFELDGGTLIYGSQEEEDLTLDFGIDQDGFISLQYYGVNSNDTTKTFTGWLVGDTAYERDAKIPAKVGERLTITAVYKNKLAVTLVNGDQTEVCYADAGEQIYLPYETKESTAQYSYEFAGWRAEDGTVYSSTALYTVTGNVTLTAQFNETVRNYTVTFDANGGSIGGDATYSTTLVYGTMPTLSTTPIRESSATARYEFAGWSPALTAVTGEATYTAQWREIKLYTVTFDAGEGQFDSSGKRTVTITVDEGYALASYDFPMTPYKKTDAGYYEFSTWSPAVAVGTVISGNVIYTATYDGELSTRTGITVSDGVNTEDIAAFFNGTSIIDGYTYVLDDEVYGKLLTVTAEGLTISGEATDISIVIQNVDVTLTDLTLTYKDKGEETPYWYCIMTYGKVNISIDGTVSIDCPTDSNAIRGDEMEDPNNAEQYIDSELTLTGVNNGVLSINSVQYGIAAYGKLTVNDLTVNLTVAPAYEDAMAIVVQDAASFHDSVITVNSGVLMASKLVLTDTSLSFTATDFAPGMSNGLYISFYNEEGGQITLMELIRSQISFEDGIAIAIVVDPDEYYVNTNMEFYGILSTYETLDAFLADVSENGYSGMVVIDTSSAIE